MGNVTETVRARLLRRQAALLLNFCRSVLQPEHDQLRAAMVEYEQSLLVQQEQRKAA